MVVRTTIGTIKKNMTLGNPLAKNVLERQRLLGTYFYQGISFTHLKNQKKNTTEVITKHPIFVTMQLLSQKIYWETHNSILVNKRLYELMLEKQLARTMDILRTEYRTVYPQMKQLKEQLYQIEDRSHRVQLQQLLSVQMKRMQGIPLSAMPQEEQQLIQKLEQAEYISEQVVHHTIDPAHSFLKEQKLQISSFEHLTDTQIEQIHTVLIKEYEKQQAGKDTQNHLQEYILNDEEMVQQTALLETQQKEEVVPEVVQTAVKAVAQLPFEQLLTQYGKQYEQIVKSKDTAWPNERQLENLTSLSSVQKEALLVERSLIYRLTEQFTEEEWQEWITKLQEIGIESSVLQPVATVQEKKALSGGKKSADIQLEAFTDMQVKQLHTFLLEEYTKLQERKKLYEAEVLQKKIEEQSIHSQEEAVETVNQLITLQNEVINTVAQLETGLETVKESEAEAINKTVNQLTTLQNKVIKTVMQLGEGLENVEKVPEQVLETPFSEGITFVETVSQERETILEHELEENAIEVPLTQFETFLENYIEQYQIEVNQMYLQQMDQLSSSMLQQVTEEQNLTTSLYNESYESNMQYAGIAERELQTRGLQTVPYTLERSLIYRLTEQFTEEEWQEWITKLQEKEIKVPVLQQIVTEQENVPLSENRKTKCIQLESFTNERVEQLHTFLLEEYVKLQQRKVIYETELLQRKMRNQSIYRQEEAVEMVNQFAILQNEATKTVTQFKAELETIGETEAKLAEKVTEQVLETSFNQMLDSNKDVLKERETVLAYSSGESVEVVQEAFLMTHYDILLQNYIEQYTEYFLEKVENLSSERVEEQLSVFNQLQTISDTYTLLQTIEQIRSVMTESTQEILEQLKTVVENDSDLRYKQPSMRLERALIHKITEGLTKQQMNTFVDWLQEKQQVQINEQKHKLLTEEERIQQVYQVFAHTNWEEVVLSQEVTTAQANTGLMTRNQSIVKAGRTSVETNLTVLQEASYIRTAFLTYVKNSTRQEQEQLRLFIAPQSDNLYEWIRKAGPTQLQTVWTSFLEYAEPEAKEKLFRFSDKQHTVAQNGWLVKVLPSFVNTHVDILEKPYAFVFQKQRVLDMVRQGGVQELMQIFTYMSAHKMLQAPQWQLREAEEIRTLLYKELRTLSLEQATNIYENVVEHLFTTKHIEETIQEQVKTVRYQSTNSVGTLLREMAQVVYKQIETKEEEQRKIETIVERYVLEEQTETKQIRQKQEKQLQQISEKIEEVDILRQQVKEQAVLLEEIQKKHTEQQIDPNQVYQSVVKKMEQQLRLERQRRGLDL